MNHADVKVRQAAYESLQSAYGKNLPGDVKYAPHDSPENRATAVAKLHE